jgi:hypothetical protein
MSVKSVFQFLPFWKGFIFINREYLNITYTAFVEIPDGHMVFEVVVVPAMVGRINQNAKKYTYPPAQLFRLKERTMSTIVKNDKNTYQEACRKNR